MIIFDCYQGASADMLLSSILDLGGKFKLPESIIEKLHLKNIKINVEKKIKSSIKGTRINILSSDKKRFKSINEIKKIINNADVSNTLKKKILKTYEVIFHSESEVHGKSVEECHLHELASQDTLVEIALFFKLLEREKVFCRPLKLGSGCVHSAHGELPLPSPATIQILKGIPVRMADSEKELVTPTAAALLKTAAEFSLPELTVEKVGYGIGSRSILRAFKGRIAEGNQNDLIQVEVNIDDMIPEDIASFSNDILRVALDSVVVPSLMKKGRPGYLLKIICRESDFQSISETILTNTTTAGFRYWNISRDILQRKNVKFNSSYGKCRIKVLKLPNGFTRAKPEYDDLKSISNRTGESVSVLREKILGEFLYE